VVFPVKILARRMATLVEDFHDFPVSVLANSRIVLKVDTSRITMRYAYNLLMNFFLLLFYVNCVSWLFALSLLWGRVGLIIYNRH
jgi:hypothetical protein